MTQGPSDEWSDGDRHDGTRGRLSHRLTVLARAATAIRRAHALAEEAADARATAEEAFRSALENRALRDGERDARDEPAAREELETAVRRFAMRLRADDAPPEIAVRRVKSAVEPAILSARDLDRADVEWRRAVASDVVKWFVEAYYAA
jgi:hypothetical protein